MFDLDSRDLGPASFNAEATRKGHRVISRHPIYRFGAEESLGRIEDTFETAVAGRKPTKIGTSGTG